MKKIFIFFFVLLCMSFGSRVSAQQVPLLIWGVNVLATQATSSTVTWNTNYSASGYVDYGTTTSYGLKTLPINNHTQFLVQLPDLLPLTTYNFRITVVDDAAVSTSSANYTLKTKEAPAGYTAASPTIILLPPTLPPVPPPIPALAQPYSTSSTTSAPATINTSPINPSNVFVPSAYYYITKNLYFGLKDSEVQILQNFLISKGYLAPGNNTGFFGYKTRDAVRAFQCKNNIVCSGIAYGLVGPKTRSAINAQ